MIRNIETWILRGFSEKEIAAAHGRSTTELRIVRAALRDELRTNGAEPEEGAE